MREADTLGINLATIEEVRKIAKFIGSEVLISNPSSEYRTERIEICEPPESQQLAKLLHILEERYGFKPWPHAVFDMRQRDKYFGVERSRVFSKKEINSAEYLSFFCSTSVGHAVFRTEEQFVHDTYVVDKMKKTKHPNAIGCLQPFNALAVSAQMREELIKKNLTGLNVDQEVIGSNGNLFKLGSQIILPRTLTRLVNGQGEDVDPDVWKVTTIYGGTEDHLYDDGHRPWRVQHCVCKSAKHQQPGTLADGA